MLNASALKWAVVLNNLAAAYPTGKYAEMDDVDVEQSAWVWAEALHEVPLEAIEELFRRVIRSRTDSFAPNVGDFQVTWRAWNYWYEQNTDAQDKAPVLGLPAPSGDMTGPCATASRQQIPRIKGQGMVTCHCVNQYGNYDAATLSRDRTHWVCGNDLIGLEPCHFEWPVERPFTAPPAPKASGSGRNRTSTVITSTVIASTVNTSTVIPTVSAPSPIENAAKLCAVDLDTLDSPELARFSAFVRDWQDKYDCALAPELYEEHYPIWLNQRFDEEERARLVVNA